MINDKTHEITATCAHLPPQNDAVLEGQDKVNKTQSKLFPHIYTHGILRRQHQKQQEMAHTRILGWRGILLMIPNLLKHKKTQKHNNMPKQDIQEGKIEYGSNPTVNRTQNKSGSRLNPS